MPFFNDNITAEALATSTTQRQVPNVQATAAVTTSLTLASNSLQIFTGTVAGQVVQLPSATTIGTGISFWFFNTSTQSITIQDGGANLLYTLPASQNVIFFLETNTTTAGVWVYDSSAFSTAGLFTQGSVIFAGPTGALAQDNAKLFWDDTNYRLGINIQTPLAPIHMVATAGNGNILLDAYYGVGTYGFTGRQARGTPAAPTASQASDILGGWAGRGYGATGFSASGSSQIAITASENWSDTAQGSDIIFYTTPNGSPVGSRTERFRILNSGMVGINNSSPSYELDVVGGAKASLGFFQQVQTVTANTTIAAGQINTVVNSSSPTTMTLPQASTLLTTEGGATYSQPYTINNWGSGTVTVATFSGDTIFGSTTIQIKTKSSVTLLPCSLGWVEQ